MAKNRIKTYTTESFREKFMEPELDKFLKPGFGSFFITRVQDMLRHIRLPVPPVRSTIHTLIFLTEGEANMSIGSYTYCISAGECLLVPQGQVYAFDRLDKNKGYICGFHPDMVATGKQGNKELLKSFTFLNAWADPHISPGKQEGKFILQLLRRLLESYERHGLAQRDIIQSYLIALLSEIRYVYEKKQYHYGQSAAHTLANRFRELLFAHFRTIQVVSGYAALMHISPNHLNKTLKAFTGKSPSRWINDMLVMEAKVLLSQTTWSISEISEEIGILDASYFSRMFRKHTGMSPLYFRHMIEMS